MRRFAKLSTLSLCVASLLVAGICSLGFAGQDPPADPPKPVTVGDLVKSLSDAKAAQANAQTTRDAAAKALADADAALAIQSTSVVTADTAIKSAVATVGPIIVQGVVYEALADGSYRSFTPMPADTPVPK